MQFNLKTRYEKNPLINKMIITPTSKKIKISPTGTAGTHITTFKKVDSKEFSELFASNMALTFGLKKAGEKVFKILTWTVQQSKNKDEVALDSIVLSEFKKNNQVSISISVFQRGINELEKAKIIAKTKRKGFYFINPNFVFNGNRIVFSTAIQLQEK